MSRWSKLPLSQANQPGHKSKYFGKSPRFNTAGRRVVNEAWDKRPCFRRANASAIIALVARQVPNDAVIEALGHVNYPGYAADIVALGIVEDAQPAQSGGYAITIRQVTERDEVIRELAGRIHHALTHDLGVPSVELRVHRIEAELGEK